MDGKLDMMSQMSHSFFQTISASVVGTILQMTFFVLFFGGLLAELPSIVGFISCFLIGLLSLIAGVYSIKKGYCDFFWLTLYAIGSSFISILILLLTLYMYLSVEGDGMGPLLLQ
ncbi:hypothetical protein RYX56_00570 [Alkalihalophilus lindianensis]|uniref:Uncharacterized protein n=1 Tax=Alkalihalophilus lindianensis TaxID=1630542 RepID=A0ABU3X4P7_9BACI|nr:hypothetical protein [Alkalihalophilus lindianensis]MDV2682857.1 hypothetical protein [Alkalihalophilus lindianensis]